MATVVLFTTDPSLQEVARLLSPPPSTALRIAGDRNQLHAELLSTPGRVLFDLNACQSADVLECVREIKGMVSGAQLIVFLDHLVGDLPVRAKLAGADRVVPRAQLERELASLLDR
jgi:hypothetical protein